MKAGCDRDAGREDAPAAASGEACVRPGTKGAMNGSRGVPEDGAADGVDVSLIIPVHNEAEAIAAVLAEAFDVLARLAGRHEVLVVDDGSTDDTAAVLARSRSRFPALRVLTLSPNSGQSAAFGAGFRACRGDVVVLMDGDGQNDPHDIPRLLAALRDCDACCGFRATRRDVWSKRLGSRLANALRRSVLHDGVSDTGCSLKVIRAGFVRDLPMTLRGMHRFLPALLLMRGAKIVQLPVNHRPRAAGRSKYTNLGRLAETVWDLWAVRWMQKRHRRFDVREES
jgi:dolichol-phosphate mannosyltransferase